ncbi:hypothetical protein [Nonomuraea sp. B19D2]|uniref:hypothetical protein n=1 Tax=Nonomuraea sp. B19D2 TaxID=3159561 RepID=UPI0032DB48D1
MEPVKKAFDGDAGPESTALLPSAAAIAAPFRHADDRYLRLYTDPPDDIAAGYVEDL